MTPTLFGRMQTRIFLVVCVALPWTLLIGWLLPRGPGAPLLDTGEELATIYGTALTALVIVAVAGLVLWEPLYHLLQQLRWEKDWPILFFLLSGIHEGLFTWIVLPKPDNGAADQWTFAVHFATTWLVIWLFVIGPIRIFFVRYRFRGGRLL